MGGEVESVGAADREYDPAHPTQFLPVKQLDVLGDRTPEDVVMMQGEKGLLS